MKKSIYIAIIHLFVNISVSYSQNNKEISFDNELNFKNIEFIKNLNITLNNKIIESNKITDLDIVSFSGTTSIIIDSHVGSKIENRIGKELVTYICNKNYSKTSSSLEGLTTKKLYHEYDSPIKKSYYNFIINNEEYDYFSDLDNYIYYKNKLIKCDDYINQDYRFQSICTELSNGINLSYLFNLSGLLCGSIVVSNDGSTVVKIYDDFRVLKNIKIPFKTITILNYNTISISEIEKVNINDNTINYKLFE